MDQLTTDLVTYLRDPGSQDPADNRLFAELAARKPAIRLGPVWVLSRYDLVAKVASDPRCELRLPAAWAQTPDTDPAVASIIERLMPVRPAPDHRRLRRLLAPEFQARTIQRLGAHVHEIVGELFAAAADAGECDFVADVCGPLPVYTTARMLGIPDGERQYLLTCARALNGSILDEFGRLSTWPGTPGGGRDAAPHDAAGGSSGLTEVLGYIEDLVRQRRRTGGTDLISRLIGQADSPDGKLDHDELVALVAMLFMTGIDTVGSSLANVVVALSRNPGVWRRVRRDPALAERAYVEGVRLHPALPVASRITSADMDIAGRTVPAGSTVLLLFGAANLDPRVFPEPRVFDLDRRQTNHLGFGHGPHYCLGASLGILQGEAVLRALVDHAVDLAAIEASTARRAELAFHSVAGIRMRIRPPTGLAA